MILRLSTEFGFKITALHHASETYRMIPQLERFKPITLALFASDGAFEPVRRISYHLRALLTRR